MHITTGPMGRALANGCKGGPEVAAKTVKLLAELAEAPCRALPATCSLACRRWQLRTGLAWVTTLVYTLGCWRGQLRRGLAWTTTLATSEFNSFTAATRKRQQQHHDIESSIKFDIAEYKKCMSVALHALTCGTQTVRDALMWCSSGSPTGFVNAYDVTGWSAGRCTTNERGNCVLVVRDGCRLGWASTLARVMA